MTMSVMMMFRQPTSSANGCRTIRSGRRCLLRRFPCRWPAASATLLLVVLAFIVPACVVPACAQQPAATPADITFVLQDADRTASWPVAVREVAIDGKPIRFDRPVHVEGAWLRTVTVTLRNVSPKTIVQGGINLVFPESGDGSAAHPFEACWSQQGKVPKIVYLAHDGYRLPPGYDLQEPLQLAPGADLRLTFSACGDGTQAKLAGQPIHQASFTLTTFYFADDSRWSAQQYYLPPLPGTRQWRRVTPSEFLHSSGAGQ
jgi:hypothetical protein